MITVMGDVINIRIRLNELKTKFDSAMDAGEEFTALKKIHMEIKELEWHLNVMEWEANHGRTHSIYYREIIAK